MFIMAEGSHLEIVHFSRVLTSAVSFHKHFQHCHQQTDEFWLQLSHYLLEDATSLNS